MVEETKNKKDQIEKEAENVGIQEVLKQLDEDFLRDDLIQDNKLHFSLNDQLYRVRMPNQRETSQAKGIRNSSYIELIQKKNTLTKKKLKEVLKKNQQIDVDVLRKEADDLEKKMLDLYISLAQRKDSEVKSIAGLKKQIDEIRIKRTKIIFELADYLAPSIESQSEDVYMEYLTSICTEKFEVEKDSKENKGVWISVWKDSEEFERDSSKVRTMAMGYLTHLLIARG